jgi:hypothetical protein
MLKSYEAIYDDGHLQWLGSPPRLKHARVMVVIAESDEDEALEHPQQAMNGVRLAAILRETDAHVLAGVAEKFGDPAEWQREQRRERTLPGREKG